jgi:hypothetical protein
MTTPLSERDPRPSLKSERLMCMRLGTGQPGATLVTCIL